MTYKIKVTFRQGKILRCLLEEGLTQTQTAQKLGCTPSNINLTLKRLMKKYPRLKVNIYDKWYSTYDVPEKFVRNE